VSEFESGSVLFSLRNRPAFNSPARIARLCDPQCCGKRRGGKVAMRNSIFAAALFVTGCLLASSAAPQDLPGGSYISRPQDPPLHHVGRLRGDRVGRAAWVRRLRGPGRRQRRALRVASAERRRPARPDARAGRELQRCDFCGWRRRSYRGGSLAARGVRSRSMRPQARRECR
jgi:hypothetical protein